MTRYFGGWGHGPSKEARAVADARRDAVACAWARVTYDFQDDVHVLPVAVLRDGLGLTDESIDEVLALTVDAAWECLLAQGRVYITRIAAPVS
jgi:hypothetical protein